MRWRNLLTIMSCVVAIFKNEGGERASHKVDVYQ